jgi:hypothetical protein
MVRIHVKNNSEGNGIENTLSILPNGNPSLTDEVLGQLVVANLRESADIYGKNHVFHHISECQGKPVGPDIYVVAAAMFKGEELPQLVPPKMKALMIFTLLYGAEKFDRKNWVRHALDTIAVPELEVFGELPQDVIEKFPIDEEFLQRASGYSTRTAFGYLYYEK